MTQTKPTRVFSGTRATGQIHLGNYLGAIKGYIELQDDPQLSCIYMAMDLHTITTPYEHRQLGHRTKEIILDYLAAGVNPDKAIITAQSLVPEHTYLSWLFSSVVSVASMKHLPTFKDKVRQHPDHVTMALFNYPILMAADILAYQAELVPVGVDQEPHLEVARLISRKLNQSYGTNLPEPRRHATAGEYVPSLLGEGKMSKSIPNSYINLTDSLGEIERKLAAVPTDSGSGEQLPSSGGVWALLTLVELFIGQDRRQQLEKQYQQDQIRYQSLKEELAAAIHQELKPIQARRKQLASDQAQIDQIISDGSSQARQLAQSTLTTVKRAMGLYSPPTNP